jgi:hypothetical protein
VSKPFPFRRTAASLKISGADSLSEGSGGVLNDEPSTPCQDEPEADNDIIEIVDLKKTATA